MVVRKHVPARLQNGQPNPERICQLCFHYGGIMSNIKPGKGWVHTSCAMYIPQTQFIDGGINIENALMRPKRGDCSLCKSTNGITLRCGYAECTRCVHVHCAVRCLLFFNLLGVLVLSFLFCHTTFDFLLFLLLI